MAKNCNACSELQEKAADFVVNGVTDDVCTSLKNNKGFNPSSGNDDCTDLNNANDCLIGNMEDEVDAYEVCDWKEYTKKLVYNAWTVLKAMICAICGLWTRVETLECKFNGLTKTQNFSPAAHRWRRRNFESGIGTVRSATPKPAAGLPCRYNGAHIPYPPAR